MFICSFLKAAKKGETVVIDAETVKLGRTLAYLAVEFRNKQNNELLATGKHTKYLSWSFLAPNSIPISFNE